MPQWAVQPFDVQLVEKLFFKALVLRVIPHDRLLELLFLFRCPYDCTESMSCCEIQVAINGAAP